MPKTLSLKKSQTNASKNQKAITQFFKSAPNNPSKSPVKQHCVETTSNSKPIKRKVSSPIDGQSNFLYKDYHNNNEERTSKKCKIDRSNISLEKKTFILSDDDKLSTRLSPKDIVKHDYESTSCDDKSPLSSLSPNSMSDHVKDKFGSNTKNSKELIITNEKENQEYDNNDILLNNHVENIQANNRSPKKSPKGKINNVRSPLKLERSLPKFDSNEVEEIRRNHVDDVFGDEWNFDGIEESKEDLDLSLMQRCEILSVLHHPNKLELKLKNDKENEGTCFVEGIWLNTPLQQGEIISVLACRNSTGQYSVNNTSGLLVLRPDHLVSSTSVVAGVFCKRKAILQERWRGIDSANTAMTIGILIHELVQKSLTQNIKTTAALVIETDNIIKESIQLLYEAGITENEARSNMQMYIGPLADFMTMYMPGQSSCKNNEKGKWNGKIDKVLDIEENLCCPKLGLKGKIDATLQVTIHERGSISAIVPLELKSGRASMSAEHRGQLFLYGMMLSLQRQEDPTTAIQKGLLLYLKERTDLKEVSCGYPERRDLIMLRNELVQHLAVGPRDVDTEKLVDIEDASRLLQQSLPEPVHHHAACAKCPYLTLCSLHLWHTDDGPKVTESHPLSKLKEDALGHLTPAHIKYFLHWTSLLRLEERGQMSASPLHALWTDSVDKRTKRGVCAANLKLKDVSNSSDKFLHVFIRESASNVSSLNIDKSVKGPQEGEFSIVSIENRPWIAAGVVTVSNNTELHILLERDLSRRLNKHTLFHVDTYESYATTVQNLTNLGVLMEDSERAMRLRRLIIDKGIPEFASKLPREVGRLGSKLMRSLNIEQQRAVLRALAADHYALLRGLPGTGKTQTISVLIQMLVALKQRVLVTAHTHSAVDTVLNRLPASLQVMRLGAAQRVAGGVRARCEHALLRHTSTTLQRAQLYDSMDVVGVTCLGAAHPMLAKTTFDVCIVDEATQVLQCTVLRPLFAAKRFVLVGDPEQLPPVVKSRTARRLGMEESLFHRLMQEKALSTLRLQYRMNQPLVDVANKVAYNDSLKCANQSVAQAKLKINFQKIKSRCSVQSPWLVKTCSPEFEDAAIFLNLELVAADKTDSDKTLSNFEEACVVMTLIETLKEANVSPADIGIIAPFRDQVALLRRCLKSQDVEVSTVDQFQGKDKNVIIYSCTKRNISDGRTVKEGEVLNDQRRLAVSVTRAKHKLIIIGDLHALRRYPTVLRLIEACTTISIDHETVSTLMKKYRNVID
ncbi:DNA replication ATP-dependent helicase/nuclease DNA2 isoform X1 [Nymphalis io]|uniref:DNA replication ATP-dependent helicase/nuclease DNA2 isoform X1 n=1 Tax=Inachis io TaxID=171585 RepID=UPI002169773A|nr:DNA replication ATP-dependent helicase/nuclease DNA2 isoform X1 [Nymphalis io]